MRYPIDPCVHTWQKKDGRFLKVMYFARDETYRLFEGHQGFLQHEEQPCDQTDELMKEILILKNEVNNPDN